MVGLYSKCNDINIIKLLISISDINKTDISEYTVLIIAERLKYDVNIIKLFINQKTDIKKNFYGKTPLKYLFKNYSEKDISLILSFFVIVNKNGINSMKLIVDDENFKYFLEIPICKEKDIFYWKLSNYLNWNKRKANINYSLIFGD